MSDFNLKKFVVCTDAGLSSIANRKFNDAPNRRFVTVQSVKKLKGFLKEFALDPSGWQLSGSNKTYTLPTEGDDESFDRVFYKERWIKEDGLEQRLIVTFSPKYRDYQRKIRNHQIERARKVADSGKEHFRQNDYKRFIEETCVTDDGEIASRKLRGINAARIEDEEQYDGFYAVCTNLEDDAAVIIAINKKRWEIEECFRIIKTEFKAHPVYMSRKDRITAHFMTCFMALVIYRILEKKLDEKYTCEAIIRTLRTMDMLIVPGEGYIPEYTRSDLTDDLHDAFGFRTDYQIVPQKEMKKICSDTKK